MSAITSSAHVIMNEDSGRADKGALADQIASAFAAHGWQVEFVMVGRQTLHRRALQTVEGAPGVVVVAGGDGTINAVASACVQAKRPLGIISAGTFNYVARNLRLPTEVAQAAAVIVAGLKRPIDVGDINGQLFLNNAGIGLYARMLERREQDKRRFGRRRLVAFLSGLYCVLSAYPRYAVELVVDGRIQRHRMATLFFGCNALQLQDFNLAVADCLRQHKLSVVALSPQRRGDIIVAAGAALLGRLEDLSVADTFCAATLQVRTWHRRLKVVIDGEIVLLRPPLIVRLRPAALEVFAPPEPEEAEDL